MQRFRKSFKRKSGVRDAKLIVIASEGEKTEKQYFEGIAHSDKYKNPKVHVEVLERTAGKSDPKQCLASLNKFKKEYKLNVYDELWLVCDIDRWGERKLSEVNRLCKQKRYLIAVSNPCFETWLLLHLIDLTDYSIDELDSFNSCRDVFALLREVSKGYNKAKLNIDNYIELVGHAIRQAEQLDNVECDWPVIFGSKVANLMKSIINKED